MARSGEARELGAGNRLLPGGSVLGRNDPILLTGDDERRRLDAGEAPRDPGVGDGPQELGRRAQVEHLGHQPLDRVSLLDHERVA